MTYALVVFFVLTGESYVDRTGLSLHQCAGQAAMSRIETKDLERHIGEIKYFCAVETGG